MIIQVISGGQTGVDRAALDAAIALGIPYGGWCPRGRRAEDGVIPTKYKLAETESRDYRDRTLRNILDADVTVILTYGPATPGTTLTRTLCEMHNKELIVCNPQSVPTMDDAIDPHGTFALMETIHGVVNVAGPRESSRPGIGALARVWCKRVFASCR